MLNVTYEHIYVEQQRRLRAGTLQMSDLMAWRRKRNACETVGCVDAVFAEWRRMTEKRPPGHAPLPRTVASPESRPTATIPTPAPPPLVADSPAPALPAPLATPAKPEPVSIAASPALVRTTTRSSAPWAFAWLALPVAIVCTLGWALMHGRGHEMAPAPVRSLVDRLHHLPHMALVLGALVLLNGLLLVLVLES
jgi:hypothetical protein